MVRDRELSMMRLGESHQKATPYQVLSTRSVTVAHAQSVDILKPCVAKRGRNEPRTEWNQEVIVLQYGCGCWTRGQKFALIRTVCLCVRTLISRSVTATKTDKHQQRVKSSV